MRWLAESYAQTRIQIHLFFCRKNDRAFGNYDPITNEILALKQAWPSFASESSIYYPLIRGEY